MIKSFQKFNSSLKGMSCSPEMGKRLSAFVLVGGCSLLALWSITFRLSLVTEAQSSMHVPYSLERQVESLRVTWSDQEEEAVKQEWQDVKAKSFEDYDHLVRWVTQMTAQARALGLQVDYKIGEESKPIQGVPEMHLIPMELTVQSPNLSKGYRQFMQFVRALSEDDVMINFEIIELSGSGRGAQKMELRFHGFLQQDI